MTTRSRTRLAAQQSSEDLPTTETPKTLTPIEPGAKRKRGKTVGVSATPSAKRPATTATKNPSPSAAGQNTSGGSPTLTQEHHPTPRLYCTRPSNNLHPAKSVGLQKRTQADVKAIAAAKRAAKQAKVDAIEQEQVDKDERERRGVRAVAAVLDERKQQESPDHPHSTDIVDHDEFDIPDADVPPDSASDGLVFDDTSDGDGHSDENVGATEKFQLNARGKAHVQKDSSVVPKAVKPKVSATEKRAQRSHAIWSDIEFARTPVVSENKTTVSTKPKVVAREQKAPVPTIRAGLDKEWLTSEQQYKHAKVTRRENEAIGGLTDVNVVVAKPKKQNTSRCQMAVVDDDDVDDMPVAVGRLIKTSRAAKSEVDPNKSIALKNMPDWIRGELNEGTGRIIPTVIEFYGRQADPWELDYQENEVFLWLAQTIIDYLFPDVQYTLSKSDQIYTKIRQGISNIRHKMATTAMQYMKTRVGKLKSHKAVKELVVRALQPDDGELYWGDRANKEAFTSPCVLKVFAEHIKATSCSILDELDIQDGDAPCGNDLQLTSSLPQGALTMAICAAHRAFQMFQRTGRFEPMGAFSEANLMGDKLRVGIWHAHAQSVNAIFMPLHKQHRFDALITKAYMYVKDSESAEHGGDVQAAHVNSSGAFYINVPSSP